MSLVFRILSDEQRGRIATAAFDLLQGVGVRLTEPQARELLHGAGARIDGQRVRIPVELITQAIDSAPSSIAIYTRHGDRAMHLGGTSAYFGAHTDAPDVLDPFSGERRPCRVADAARIARLIDALPNISYTTASGMVSDRPAEVADRAALAQCLIHSPKPVLAMPVTHQALVDCREMAALAVGSDSALRERPLLTVYSEPVSPLIHPDDSIRRLLYSAEHEIPLVYSAYAAMGGTAPMSPAAITVQLCAESLSALVVHQLKRKGAPFIFGGMASVMDMQTTVFSYGAPEFQRGNTLMAEMALYFDLPNFGTAGTSDAQTFDGQAVLEAASSCMMAYLVGANLIHDVGLLGNATVVMPDMIVATDEIIAMLHHLFDAVEISDETLPGRHRAGGAGRRVRHTSAYLRPLPRCLVPRTAIPGRRRGLGHLSAGTIRAAGERQSLPTHGAAPASAPAWRCGQGDPGNRRASGGGAFGVAVLGQSARTPHSVPEKARTHGERPRLSSSV
jgi:trimethylamine--corrinoid protein Co-methyltransferase